LNTENAYAWPIHKWTASAAGGTIHREKPGCAMVALLEKKPRGPAAGSLSVMLFMVGLRDRLFMH
jgi:hypothetical protein